MQIRRCARLFKRLVATATAATKGPAHCFGTEEILRMSNGLTVYSTDMGGPITQLILAFKAGSRYEQSDELGLAHYLRNSVGTSSNNAFGVQMLQQCGSAGVILFSHLTRDFFAVQASVVRENARQTIPLLFELCQPAFKPWDFENVAEAVKTDTLHRKPYDLLLDYLHYAAFRSEPLGNALYAGQDTVTKYSSQKLHSFADSRLVSGQAVLVSVNVNRQDFLDCVEKHLKIREGAGKQGCASKYYGGEARYLFHSKNVHVAIVGEGASLKSPKALATQSVLLNLLVGNGSIKYGPNNDGVVAETIYKASGSYPFELSAVNQVYWDTGLAGIYISTDADMIVPLVHAAVKAINSVTVNEKMLTKAKRMAVVDYLIRRENSYNIALSCAEQLLGTNAVVSTSEFIKFIDDVTEEDVKEAVTRMASKLSMASVGNVHQVPYLDDLLSKIE